MKLRAKVNLALSGAFFVGLLVATGGAYKILTDEAVESSARDARLVMEQASAIRTYTADAIRPLLERQMNVQFLPHAIPSYAAQTNFRIVQKKLPEYAYREPTLNPTNINDRAVDWEADIINDFRTNPDKTERMRIRDTAAGKFLTLARPLKVGSAACLDLPQHARSGTRDNGGALWIAERVRLETGRNRCRTGGFDPARRAAAARL